MIPPLTAAAHAERVCRRRHLADLRIETRQQVGTWQRVSQQRPGQELAGLGVVDTLLPQRLADPLRDAAVALAVQRVLVMHFAPRPARDIASARVLECLQAPWCPSRWADYLLDTS